MIAIKIKLYEEESTAVNIYGPSIMTFLSSKLEIYIQVDKNIDKKIKSGSDI